MEHLKKIKDCVVEEVYEQLNHNLEHADTHELGEAVDMIKDIAEAMYYCSVVDAMEESQKDKDQERRTVYYTERVYPPMYGRKPTGMNDWDIDHTKSEMDSYLRDAREGRSGITRRTYMEGKATKAPKEKQMKELEQYVQELSVDIAEMIRDATPEEKQMLQKKLTSLATKIDNV